MKQTDEHLGGSTTGETGEAGLRTGRELPPPPTRAGIRGAFQIRTVPYPWRRATRAAISMGLTVTVGALVGNLSWALITSMGAFTAIYAGAEPYAQRAVKCASVAVGLSLALGIGTLLAGSVWGIAIALCVVCAGATFFCGAWRVPVPSAYFFILVGAVGTGMPVEPAAAPFRAALVLLGGAIAWLVSMAGWVVNAHGPETRAVGSAFRSVADFLASVGTPSNDAMRHQATIALRDALEAVTGGELRWRRTKEAYRLYLLVQEANALFLCGIQLTLENRPVSPLLAQAVRTLGARVGRTEESAPIEIPTITYDTEVRRRMAKHLEAAVGIAVGSTPIPDGGEVPEGRSLGNELRGAFRKESLVRPATMRIGVAVVVSTLVAWALGNPRPYWVPLTCACVLQGATMVASVHRTVQRALGTTVGVLIAGGILALKPPLVLVVAAIVVLQLIVELLIVRNYGLAVVFITPLPILLIELGHAQMSVAALIEARFFDTMVGCALGLLASLLLWRRASSSRVRPVIAQVIYAVDDVLRSCARPGVKPPREVSLSRRAALQAALINLRLVYDSAINELPNNGIALESLWPVVVSTQRLGYLALAMTGVRGERPQVSDAERATLAHLVRSAETGRPPIQNVPSSAAQTAFGEEIASLRDGLVTAATAL
ncbi:FUSC family protein [Alicyclobacillus fastidiosus]|uniref:FUSC family protein n=1 Tax=Alicyclobacillus fastidiosus TaxID=392011 RepID=A0ABY6ZC69_9BACL|nr:FUSC family protein [Alicyclobacillus fastidiosus]WAH40330.1 FUSC family protein [Alicyclobacillus fastidiosus]GMA61713.1 putative membrane protein YvaC [Alicyclobacillus fastidiosus]